MKLHWGGVLLLGSLLMGCATSHVVFLDTGQGEPIVYVPPRNVEPIEIAEGEFQKLMTQLVLDMRFSVRAENDVRKRLRLASSDPEPRTQGGDYGAWCSQQDNPGECLTLLGDGFSFLDATARRKMALSFAWDGVWAGVQGAVKEVVNPLALKAMITSAMAAYMFLVVAPEPLTKVVAIALTAYIVAYVGLDAFANIVKGWQRLSMDSERAVSFEELEDAGHNFGKVIGQNGARVLILALTAALGGGAANMASKGPMLPGFARAALAAETNAGFSLSAAMAGGVRSISVAEGVMTVGLVPAAVAVAMQGASGGATQGGGSGPTNLWTNRVSPGGNKYRFNTGHGYNRPHESPGGLSKSFAGTGLTADEIETAIMRQLESFRAGGGSLPVAGTPGFKGPFQDSIRMGAHQVGFRAVMLNTGEIVVSTYFPW
ncbi:SitA5 family polymorphic toxin [Hyalangium versicolor]|uniref:SitA5 family polymorphic toxin n=1 Tax=Hyalangium versicolor TaxID=2861190 RepID=UPI001CCD1D7E|nr:hypothetical protein [Hyalangium versicolor]